VPFSNVDLIILADVSAVALKRITMPHTLQLHHLVLDTLIGIPHYVALPEVRVLYLRKPEVETQLPQGRFPKLSELNMDETNNEKLMCVVGHGVGQYLQTLRISFCRCRSDDELQPLQLDKMLAACPNLSELCVKTVGLQCAGRLRPDTLRQLRILRICCHFGKGMAQQGNVPQLLFLAPNLSHVELASDLLSNEDLMQLTELVEQRACLRHLEQLRFSIIYQGTNYTQQLIRLADLFVISCSNHCERLREVVVGNYLNPWIYNHDIFE
jgi:hypothetical protein